MWHGERIVVKPDLYDYRFRLYLAGEVITSITPRRTTPTKSPMQCLDREWNVLAVLVHNHVPQKVLNPGCELFPSMLSDQTPRGTVTRPNSIRDKSKNVHIVTQALVPLQTRLEMYTLLLKP